MYSAADEDYRATSMTVMFQAAETSQVVMVPILGDDTFEGVEQFTARLSVPPGQDRVMLGTDMATVEITDNDRELHEDTAVLSNSLLLLLSFPL